ESGSLSSLISYLESKGVTGPSSFHHNTGSNWFKGMYDHDDSHPRYIYTTGAGWVDIKHFAASAYATWNLWSSWALDYGEGQEYEQFKNNAPSAYSYEDLTSNMLGAYFQGVYRFSDEARSLSYTDALSKFFSELGAVEDWKSAAPNVGIVGDSYAKEDDSGVKNHTYEVMFNTESNNSLLNLIYKWMKETKHIDPSEDQLDNSKRREARVKKMNEEGPSPCRPFE